MWFGSCTSRQDPQILTSRGKNASGSLSWDGVRKVSHGGETPRSTNVCVRGCPQSRQGGTSGALAVLDMCASPSQFLDVEVTGYRQARLGE